MSKEMLIWGMTGCSILIPDGKSPFADLSHSLPLMFFHASLVLLTVGEKRRGIADNIFYLFFFALCKSRTKTVWEWMWTFCVSRWLLFSFRRDKRQMLLKHTLVLKNETFLILIISTWNMNSTSLFLLSGKLSADTVFNIHLHINNTNYNHRGYWSINEDMAPIGFTESRIYYFST